MPVLQEDDNGFKLYESRAIGRYVAKKYGKNSGLIPADLTADALFEQAASVELSYFDGPATGIAKERVFKP